MSYLLRLVVPDKPGALGAVATALGAAGADIVSLDVLERGQGVAVDDVVVDLPRDRVPDSLITAAQSVPVVRVATIPVAGTSSSPLGRNTTFTGRSSALPVRLARSTVGSGIA